MAAAGMGGTETICVRDKMVANKASVLSASRTNRVFLGGSSSSFSSLLAVSTRMNWAP